MNTKTDQQYVAFKTEFEADFSDKLQALEVVPKHLLDAICYACLGGGKRVRPYLVFLTAQACQQYDQINRDVDLIYHSVLHASIAIELIHTYSLIHDDLPAMDDDDLRRGQPSVHKAFDEATAILVGDALQCLAFEYVSDYACVDKVKYLVYHLSRASGVHGMVSGQALDLSFESAYESLPFAQQCSQLMQIHQLKTGALLKCSLQLGAVVAGVDVASSYFSNISALGEKFGFFYQIQDDILDIESSTAQLGKPQATDIKNRKLTFPAIYGLNKSKEMANVCWQEIETLITLCERDGFNIHLGMLNFFELMRDRDR